MENPFKSKVITAYDYKLVDISEFYVPFRLDEEELEESLLSVRKKYAYMSPVDTIEEGDFATLCCLSENKRFRKDSVTVCVGKKLYSRKLEAGLVGMSVGESRQLEAENASVQVTVEKVERKVLPELDDAFVAANFESVKTVEELKNWYIDRQRENHLMSQAALAAEYISEETIKKSNLVIDENERQQERKKAEQIVRQMWEFNGVPIDTMSDEQAQELTGYPSAEAYLNWFADACEQELSASVLGYHILCEGGTPLTEEMYEKELESVAAEAGTPVEEMRKQYRFETFAHQKSAEYFSEMLQDYAYKKIKENTK